MHEGRLVFAQLMDFIPKRDFDDCVRRYRGNYRVREFEHVQRLSVDGHLAALSHLGRREYSRRL